MNHRNNALDIVLGWAVICAMLSCIVMWCVLLCGYYALMWCVMFCCAVLSDKLSHVALICAVLHSTVVLWCDRACCRAVTLYDALQCAVLWCVMFMSCDVQRCCAMHASTSCWPLLLVFLGGVTPGGQSGSLGQMSERGRGPPSTTAGGQAVLMTLP